ncbi:hypothetical protein KW842_24380 [Duganella sp. sic0402]|nr:hypothetical protein [Duganella sp. sic0402]
MAAAGISVSIDATYRPIKRSYLMHWCWRIKNDGLAPSTIPAMPGVEIEWEHATMSASLSAASDLTEARKKEIERSVVKYCGKAQRQFRKLNAQYKSDARITEIIRQHANDTVIGFR